MTDAERRAALVDKVARAIATRVMDNFFVQAEEAIAIVLEEAAKVTENEIGSSRREIAAAIRALIPGASSSGS